MYKYEAVVTLTLVLGKKHVFSSRIDSRSQMELLYLHI